MERSEYEEKYGLLKCSKSLEKIKIAAKNNGDWINRKKEVGEDLSEYKSKMGAAVSQSIMSNPDERLRRAGLMGQLNKRDSARKRSSDTAKITSARPEILENRAKQLKNWRDENPEEFYDICFLKMINAPVNHTKPEKILYDLLPKNFTYGQIIKSDKFKKINKSGRKQLDFGNEEKTIYIEFDGHHHFMVKFNETEETLKLIQEKDRIVNEIINERKLTLIRISYDQFSYKKKGYFKSECLERLNEILDNPIHGVHYIGTAYNKV